VKYFASLWVWFASRTLDARHIHNLLVTGMDHHVSNVGQQNLVAVRQACLLLQNQPRLTITNYYQPIFSDFYPPKPLNRTRTLSVATKKNWESNMHCHADVSRGALLPTQSLCVALQHSYAETEECHSCASFTSKAISCKSLYASRFRFSHNVLKIALCMPPTGPTDVGLVCCACTSSDWVTWHIPV